MLYIDNFERKVDNYYGIDDVIVDVRQNEMAITKEKIHNAIRGKIQRIHTAGPTIFLEVSSPLSDQAFYISVGYSQFVLENLRLVMKFIYIRS